MNWLVVSKITLAKKIEKFTFVLLFFGIDSSIDISIKKKLGHKNIEVRILRN